MLILDLLSNTAFMGTNEDGLPSPSFPGEDGTHYIPGLLTAAAIKKLLAYSNEIAKLAAVARSVALIIPIPRYVTEKCCWDSGHVDTFNNDDFEMTCSQAWKCTKKS
jgi:hypothetical protein